MKKNLIIINKLSLGGAEEFFCELGKRLEGQCFFAVLENDFSFKINFDLRKYNIPKYFPRLLKILIKILILFHLKFKYMNIVCFDNETAIISYLVNRKSTKVVLHTYLPKFYKTNINLFSKIFSNIYKNSGIISISKTTTRGFENFTKIKNSFIPIMYNILNYEKLKLENSLNLNEPIFFLLSRFDKDKNIELSLKLIFYIKNSLNQHNIKLFIFGDGSKKNDIFKKIDFYDLNKNVFIKSFQRKPFKFLKRSDIFLNFSYFEGWSRVVHECSYLGVRGVSFDCPYGPKEILFNDLDKKIKYPSLINNIYLIEVIKNYDNQNFDNISNEEINLANLMVEIFKSKFLDKKNDYINKYSQSNEELMEIISI